jgi:hypothetical protein
MDRLSFRPGVARQKPVTICLWIYRFSVQKCANDLLYQALFTRQNGCMSAKEINSKVLFKITVATGSRERILLSFMEIVG